MAGERPPTVASPSPFFKYINQDRSKLRFSVVLGERGPDNLREGFWLPAYNASYYWGEEAGGGDISTYRLRVAQAGFQHARHFGQAEGWKSVELQTKMDVNRKRNLLMSVGWSYRINSTRRQSGVGRSREITPW